MSPEELAEKAQEAALRASILTETVNLLNAVGQYMNDEPDSPMEDQHEAALNDRVAHLVRDHTELIGHLLIAMGVMIIETADWDSVQGWLSDQEARINEMMGEAHGNSD